jgi:hypothetical protein
LTQSTNKRPLERYCWPHGTPIVRKESFRKMRSSETLFYLNEMLNIPSEMFYQHEFAKEKEREKREFHRLHTDAILKLEAQREELFDQWDENQSSNAVCQYENAQELLLSELERNLHL